uniref:Scaffold attachment factor B n=1 Tax=Strigops habroptila TaxID=2489341 RepID=A0A672TYK5_STRHB
CAHQLAAGPGEPASLCAAGLSGSEPETRRRLSELRVIDLRAELKRRSLDSGGNKSVLMERLRRAIEEEGGNPDEIPVVSENVMKKTPKRSSKGRRPDDEGVEDNGLEEDSGDGQEDIEASLDNLQDIDMMDISVLDEAEIDNGNAVDCGEDYSADNILDSLSDSKENADAEVKELPDQPAEYALGNLEFSLFYSFSLQELEELPLEPENEKILDILGETCKSELLNEETSEAERPHAQEASNVVPGKRLAEEEDALGGAQVEEDALDLDSKAAQAMARKEAKRLVVAKGETSEQTIEEAKPDSDSLVVESLSDQSSKRSPGLEASSGEPAAKGAGPEAKDSKEDAKKAEDKANSEEPPATKESSASEGGDQKKSPGEEDRDTKMISKDEKGRGGSGSGRNLWVSGLSSSTRATDLKNLFSKYGKVVGAKVVTNARSPGSRCYGFVTMSTSEEATKCINHLHRTELHGKMISVEKAKNEPAGKKPSDKKEGETRKEKDRHHPAEPKSEKTIECLAHYLFLDGFCFLASRGTERTVVMDKSKGEPVISVKTSTSKERSTKSQDRKSESKEKQDILSFDKIKEQRERERQRQREREIRETERRRDQGRKVGLGSLLMVTDLLCRRDDPYWSEAKRMALDDRYHSEFSRQDRFHDFDHRDRGRYQDHCLDRRDGSRGIPDRDGQHYPEERHGGPERHSRDSWGGYGSDRRMNEGRGIPPPTRAGPGWGEDGPRLEGHRDRSWQGSVAGGVMGRDREQGTLAASSVVSPLPAAPLPAAVPIPLQL